MSNIRDKAAEGGKARARKLTKEERSEIARAAAAKRWGTNMPIADYTGEMRIGGKTIACAVLEDETRLINQGTFMLALGRAEKAKGGTGAAAGGLPPFLSARNLAPFIPDSLREAATPVPYRTRTGAKAYGFRADILPEVCDVFIDADEAGRLLASQKPAADAARVLIRGLAHVGIIALVDEATGYEVNRERQALQKILEEYVAEVLQPWVKRFPDEFFSELYRIYGWKYDGTSRRPQYVGKFINRYIYDQLPQGVHEELEVKNPKNEAGNRTHRHHQFLTTDTGVSALDRQIASVITLMRISDDKKKFDLLFRQAFPDEKKPKPLFVEIPKR